MRNAFFLAFFTLVLVVSACNSEPEFSSYSNHGINFSLPDGWKMVEEAIPEVGMYIMVEKEGEDESGQFITSILDSKIPLNSYMNVMQDELLKNLSLQNTQINFAKVTQGKFAGSESLSCTFEHNSAGLNYQGELKTFHCGEKTIYIFIQETKDDVSENKAGLDLMKNSFACD